MKKRIVFYAHNLEIGGIEKALIALLIKIDNKKYQITLFLEEKKGPLLEEIPSNVEIKEYQINSNKNVVVRKAFNRIKLVFTILKNYKKFDFSCCYVPYSIPGSIMMRYFSKNNSIWVHTDYYNYFQKDRSKFKLFFNNRNVDKFKTIFIISNEAKENFLNIYPNLSDRLIVCGNLIENKKIMKLANEKAKEQKGDKKIFLNVSRHEEESKKLSRLIEAAKALAKEKNDFEIWMIGDGKDTESYISLVKKYSLENKIKFLGMKTNPYPYYKKADALVLTSDYEGFPVVYLEALIFNIRILTTVKTSNSFFDIKDYAFVCEKEVSSIYNGMKLVLDSNYKVNKLNIKKYNEYTLKTIIKAIDRE